MSAGMRDLGEYVETVFVASNLVGYLLEQGHQAVISKLGSTCQLETRVNNAVYVISITNLMGSIKNEAWRRDGAKTVSLTDRLANPEPTSTDLYIIKLIAKAASATSGHSSGEKVSWNIRIKKRTSKARKYHVEKLF